MKVKCAEDGDRGILARAAGSAGHWSHTPLHWLTLV
jgi:hypothetical protein